MTDAPVDLDELESAARAALVECDRLMAGGAPSLTDESWMKYMVHVHPYYVLALISELRAARAPVEAGVVTRDDREAAVNALREDGPSVRAWLPKGKHKAGLVFNTDLDRVAEAIAFARGAARVAPPADEVAGLLSDLKRCRWGGMNPDSPFYETTIAEAYARLENHLKGKR